jgi:hypothetical protein
MDYDDELYWDPYLEVLKSWYRACSNSVAEATDSWSGMVEGIDIWQTVEEHAVEDLSYILSKTWKYKFDAIRLLWNQEDEARVEYMFFNRMTTEEILLLENFNPEDREYNGQIVSNSFLGYPSLSTVKEVFDPRWLSSEEPYVQDLYRAESYKPPASAVSNAKKGLAQRKEWGRGGLSPSEAKSQGIDSGVTRARKISSGKVSKHDVRRMSAFNRHRKNYRPEKKMPDGGPTAGTIAWNLWGGTSGVNWAKKKSAAMNAEVVDVLPNNGDDSYEKELWVGNDSSQANAAALNYLKSKYPDNFEDIKYVLHGSSDYNKVWLTWIFENDELMDCDFCGGTDEVGYVDDDLTIKVCEHCDVDGSNPQIYSAEEVSDYNSFTNDMEALLAKYSQLLLTYETEYKDGIMEVFTRFKPYNAYFDDVDFDAEGDEPFDLDGVDFISWSEELFTMPVNCGICNGPSQYYEDNDNVCMTCDSTWVYDEGGEKGEGYYRKSAEMQAEGDEEMEAEFYVHSADEIYGPYDSLADAEDAVDRLSDKGIEIRGITRGKSEYMDAEGLTGDEDIKLGDVVRSYDFCFGGKISVDDCYVEGIVEKIAPVEWCGPNCDHYHIKTIRRIFNGKPTTHEDYYFPVADPSQTAVRRVARWSAESFGPVDDDGILAKALSRARMRSREPRKPLKIEKLPHRDQKSLKDFEAVVIPKTSGYAERAAANHMAIEASEQQQMLLELQTLLKLKIITPEDAFAMMLGE